MALTYIEEIISKFPDSGDELRNCKELYQKRLWHQLTDQLDLLILSSKCNIDFIRFEAQFIRSFRQNMNTLRYGSIVIQIAARSFNEHVINEVQGIAFCEQALNCIEEDEQKSQKEHFEDKKVDNTQTKLLIKTQVALFELTRKAVLDGDGAEKKEGDHFANTPFKIAKSKLDEIESEMEQSSRACPPLIYSRYHYVCSKVWASQEDGEELPSDVWWTAMFYQHAMSYLGYTALDQIDDPQKWAKDIALAALVAPDFYDFGELSLHPIMKSLEGTEDEWVLDVVRAYIAANVNAYNEVTVKHGANIKANNVLQTARPGILEEKIKLLSLVRLAFDKASFERIISFKEIEQVTQSEMDAVEYLIMKAMSLQLIKGVVDEVDGNVQVTWVKPAILDLDQMTAINEKVKSWIAKIDETKKEIAPQFDSLMQ